MAISSKAYEYLRIGRPILAVAYPGGLEDLIEKGNAVWVVQLEDKEGIKNVILGLLQDFFYMNRFRIAIPGYVNEFRYDRLAGRLARAFDGVFQP